MKNIIHRLHVDTALKCSSTSDERFLGWINFIPLIPQPPMRSVLIDKPWCQYLFVMKSGTFFAFQLVCVILVIVGVPQVIGGPIKKCPSTAFCEGFETDDGLCEYFCLYPECPNGQKINMDNCFDFENCECVNDPDAYEVEPIYLPEELPIDVPIYQTDSSDGPIYLTEEPIYIAENPIEEPVTTESCLDTKRKHWKCMPVQ